MPVRLKVGDYGGSHWPRTQAPGVAAGGDRGQRNFTRIGALSQAEAQTRRASDNAVSKWINDAIGRCGHDSIKSWRRFMPIESAIVVAAITIAFTGFALVLWWAEHQTRDLHPH
ncbi:MAG TPA: hypothetical protein VKT99_16920 [Xanthobacteraceae bacterium]|nr:hypothetical protein [Xanthobacteraceae bacterium]